jgi:hypothetical protein
MADRRMKAETIINVHALKGACVILCAENTKSGGFINRGYKYSQL